ncbi:leucyl/phenylalanyl-tRNA--protein transferase [Aureibaculum sp. 2210JD6-5]|uniref:leucyl/phenylalanyl-tRNA--protein transferase n=1 Tax=Aureibaculum sp. 2210JD6-5 TaxID=3103957 RepID=UPI002AACD597|nr:leucyl/phenylalanyl-tRNA--protein transferase [Aureibaculum sp. 2210JD6-5]MDY7396393.1 leucyl/phenylalanyl-tRNA--protein transferase [Aureibaculum sp. 2210JD6-5]
MILLSDKLWFPPVETASPEGIVAIGGDLSTERLLLAYKSGIFPWFNQGEPVIWYSPSERMVLFPDELKVSKSMQQVLKKDNFKVTFNQNFKEVIRACKTIYREGQGGTWITDEMEEAYIKLHELGYAKSVEVWLDDKLVGGLYGIDLGTVFCGESMFSKVSNTSKIALIKLVEKLQQEKYKLIDCQVYNKHLESFGAKEISRAEFLKYL